MFFLDVKILWFTLQANINSDVTALRRDQVYFFINNIFWVIETIQLIEMIEAISSC